MREFKMKIRKIVGGILSVILISMLLLAGCTDNKTPQVVYLLGEEYFFDTINVKVENDEEQERFVLYYNILGQEKDSHFFAFTFTHNTYDLKNSEQFEYSDNLDSKIEFNENGYYVFNDSRIFYVSYKNADVDIKRIINDKDCIIEFPIGTFVFSKHST